MNTTLMLIVFFIALVLTIGLLLQTFELFQRLYYSLKDYLYEMKHRSSSISSGYVKDNVSSSERTNDEWGFLIDGESISKSMSIRYEQYFLKTLTDDSFFKRIWLKSNKQHLSDEKLTEFISLEMISLASSSGDGQLNKFVNNFLLSSKTSKEVSCTRFFEKIFLSYRYFESNKIIAEQRKSRDFINNMSGHDFELFVRDLLIEMGITCDVTRASGDFGADIIASLKGKKIAIQCKRYNKNIGYSAVQEVLAGKSYYKCDEAWVLSNARFTKQASQGARETGVRLINVFDLQQYGLSKLLNGFQAQFNF